LARFRRNEEEARWKREKNIEKERKTKKKRDAQKDGY